jgi:hypothetical protein
LEGRKWTGLYFALALLVPLVYVIVTGHVWEDFLITFRFSQNLVNGNGLVYNLGEKVQGFTSALNVMLPAIFYAIAGHSEPAALNLYRAVCLAAYVGGGWILFRLTLRDRAGDHFAPIVFIFLYATEPKTIGFTMSGQETALMIGFLALAFWAAYHGLGKHWKVAAVAWTGLLYTRPDSPAYILAIVLGSHFFRAEKGRDYWLGALKAAAVAGLLFSPWFIWTWSYYGQPIPQTVLAKSKIPLAAYLQPVKLLQKVLGDYSIVSGQIFLPIYYGNHGWPERSLDLYGLLCTIICTVYWIVPSSDRLGRAASLTFTLAALYLSLVDTASISVCPWYLPSATVFGTFVLARAIAALSRRIIHSERGSTILARSLQLAIIAVSAILMGAATYEMRIHQIEIEDNHREQIGLYLKDVVKPDQAVYLEPIGYIGYYSQCHILDYPGLVTPKIARMKPTDGSDGRMKVIPKLMPDWMVLRLDEFTYARGVPEIRDNYVWTRCFNAQPELDKYGYIPGSGYLNGDAVFYVMHRKGVVPAKDEPAYPIPPPGK